MDNNKAVLGVGLVVGGLLLLGGGLTIGIVLSGSENRPGAQAEEDSLLDQQALLLLHHKIQQNPSPIPVSPNAEDQPALQEVKTVQPKAKQADEPPVLPAQPSADAIAGADPKQINAAIDKGVKYLKAHQNLNGTWGAGPVQAVGYTALPGLTLLECGVSPKDPVVQRAAVFVRKHAPKLTGSHETYELSLAILFLDRLGEPGDAMLIRNMALRLVAGQTAAGGWDYKVPSLKPAELDHLFAFLEKTQNPLSDPLVAAKMKTPPDPLRKGMDSKYHDPLTAGQDLQRNGFQPLTGMGPDSPARKGVEAKRGAGLQPFDPDGKTAAVDNTPKPADPAPPKTVPKAPPKGTPLRPDFLPPNLQNIPVVVNKGKAKGKAVLKSSRDDNSNSQFAMLALWAARRHGVPTDMTLLLAYQRYFTSQDARGGWGYMLTKLEQTPSMTCVGLLGLAMGHGSSPDQAGAKGPKVAGKSTAEDPAIQNGLKALGTYIGKPFPDKIKPPMENLYFLWSVERVAMLYNLKTIGGKDWYGWGAQLLVHNQLAEGSWRSKPYHGSAPTIDTCLALLFLKRSNLVQDLTDNLRLFMAITDPDAHKK